MRLTNRVLAVWILAYIGLGPAAGAPEATGSGTSMQATPRKVRAVVVTGGHSYDEEAFPKLFQGYDDIQCDLAPQKDESEILEDVGGWAYDVIVFYNMTQKISETRRRNMQRLLDRGVGVVALHHSLGAFQEWPEFEHIVGGRYYLSDTEIDGVKRAASGFKDDVRFRIHVAGGNHPVTRGVRDFEITDETYCRYTVDPEATVLLVTDDPSSEKTLAWAHVYRNARVVTIQPGHGPGTFANEQYRALVANAIRWTAGPVGREERPGNQVKVSAIAIGFGGDRDAKLKLAIEHLHAAGKNGVDIACLPEEFGGTDAEPIPGPTTQAVAELAKQYRMYVICPIREQAGEKQYNTSVLIDRQGEVAGHYRKVFVFWGEGLHCSADGVKVFDTDFGRIGILTCFDVNFPELWQECDDRNVDVVFWPSAYGGGSPLNAYATLYHYAIVPVGAGNIIDVTGKEVENVGKPMPQQFIATLDLDRAFIHSNFNDEKVPRLLKEQRGKVVQEHWYDMESWWVLRAVKPGVRVRDLCKKYGIETLREYQRRSRRQINEAREKGERI